MCVYACASVCTYVRVCRGKHPQSVGEIIKKTELILDNLSGITIYKTKIIYKDHRCSKYNIFTNEIKPLNSTGTYRQN